MATSDEQTGGIGRAVLGGATLLLAPPLIATAYLWLSRTYDLWSWQSGTPDFAALAASVAAGLVGVLALPISRVWRAVSAVAYVPVSTCVLVFWSLM